MQEVLSVRSVSKAYPGVTALQDVSFSLRPGEIRGLCGENGAGKSTFVKILMGIVQPDSGSIAINGQTQVVRGPQQAQGLGLGLVAQELSLAPHLSILDNIWLGSAEVPFLHRRASFRLRAQQALATLGLADWDLDRPVSSLTIGQRQLIEIARLLARNARVLILDEPTATLSDADIERILGILKGLRAHGRSIIYITHRLGEVFELCDSVTVLRNGQHVATQPVSEVTREQSGRADARTLVRGHVSQGGSAGGPGRSRGGRRSGRARHAAQLLHGRAARPDRLHRRADRLRREHGNARAGWPRPLGDRQRDG